MKKLIYVLLASCLPLLATAVPITREQASVIAARHFGASTSSALRSAVAPQLAYTAYDADSVPALYVYNQGSGQGFVVVSGDDASANSVVGYTDSGTFDATSIPDGLQFWLAGCKQGIAQLRATTTSATTTSTTASLRSTSASYTAVSPLLKTQWNQLEPYNYLTPILSLSDGSKVHAPTGCVATAIAQIMYYYRYPAAPTEAVPDYSGLEMSAKATAALSDSLRWNDMRTTYSGNESDNSASAYAVSALMVQIGMSVNMDYDTSGSGAYNTGIRDAIISYFGYDSLMQRVSRADYQLAQWLQMLHGQLEQARPVLYVGSSSGGGHAFVLDGCDSNGLFHINWGWGGQCDGYFDVTLCQTGTTTGTGASTTDDGYGLNQAAFLNFIPNDKIDNSAPSTFDIRFSNGGYNNSIAARRSETGAFSSITFHYSIFNEEEGLAGVFDGYLGFGYFSGDSLVVLYQQTTDTLILGQDTCKWSFKPKLYLPAGTYDLVPLYRLYGETQWQVVPEASHYVIRAVATATKLTLSMLDYKLDGSFTISGSQLTKYRETVDVTVNNTGSMEYYNRFYLMVNTSREMPSGYTALTGTTVAAGGSKQFSMNFIPDVAGLYYLWLLDASGNTLYYDSVDIADRGDVDVQMIALSANSGSKKKVVGGYYYGVVETHEAVITMVIQNRGDYYEGNLVLYYCNAASQYATTYKDQYIKMDAGQTDTFTFVLDNLADTTLYNAFLPSDGDITGLTELNYYSSVNNTAPRSQDHGIKFYMQKSGNSVVSISSASALLLYEKDGQLVISTPAAMQVRIFDAQGRLCRMPLLNEGINTIAGLQPGIYMVNGQKVVMK